eukprot:928703-Pelagomonas_calceolata.AAC.2
MGIWRVIGKALPTLTKEGTHQQKRKPPVPNTREAISQTPEPRRLWRALVDYTKRAVTDKKLAQNTRKQFYMSRHTNILCKGIECAAMPSAVAAALFEWHPHLLPLKVEMKELCSSSSINMCSFCLFKCMQMQLQYEHRCSSMSNKIAPIRAHEWTFICFSISIACPGIPHIFTVVLRWRGTFRLFVQSTEPVSFQSCTCKQYLTLRWKSLKAWALSSHLAKLKLGKGRRSGPVENLLPLAVH